MLIFLDKHTYQLLPKREQAFIIITALNQENLCEKT